MKGMLERGSFDKLFWDAAREVDPNFEQSADNQDLIEKVVDRTAPKLVTLLEEELRIGSKWNLWERRRNIKKFKKRLHRGWGVAIDQLEAFIGLNLEYGVVVSESYRSSHEENTKYEVFLRLHARSCQVAYEVLELIKGGFANGALARWRTIYEISVLIRFLTDKPVELTQRYLDYGIVENHREILEFQKNHKKLGLKAISAEEIKESRDDFEALKKKYDNDFVKPYGWTGAYLSDKKRRFSGMEETVEFKHLRSIFKMANNSIHSGSMGFLRVLGTYNQGEVMLAGPSDYGFSDPGQYTAFSLFQVSMTLFDFAPLLEDEIYIQLGEKLIDGIIRDFDGIQSQIDLERANELKNDPTKGNN
ncbi:MAG: hypothetical protein HQ556_13580 [Candidatus Marinimicrobia bacterium]|nr:hypothetical protein [Candidatus Neomarinimicrobiota bacterium]